MHTEAVGLTKTFGVSLSVTQYNGVLTRQVDDGRRFDSTAAARNHDIDLPGQTIEDFFRIIHRQVGIRQQQRRTHDRLIEFRKHRARNWMIGHADTDGLLFRVLQSPRNVACRSEDKCVWSRRMRL